MSDYKELYKMLFQAVTKSIYILQEAQQKCEEMYMKTAAEEGERRDIYQNK